MNIDKATARIREVAREMAKELGDAYHSFAETEDRLVIRLLAIAWTEAVRAEWEDVANSDPVLRASLAVAKELMTENYDTADHICMMPGAVATVCKIDGSDAVAVDVCMANVVPLSAIYTNKVSEAASIAERIEAARVRIAEAEAAPPPEPPAPLQNPWTFFGFDGPVDFNTLYDKYRSILEEEPVMPPGTYMHYQACMRELAEKQIGSPIDAS